VGQERPETLVFEVGGRRYGLASFEVVELVRVVAVVPLPAAPGWVEGVVNLRGRVVPVIDLRDRLGLPAKAVELSDQLLVARGRNFPVAVRIDRALDLGRPEVGPGRVAMLDGGGLAPVLDVGGLLTGDEWVELGRVLSGAGGGPAPGAGRGGAA